MARRAVVRLGIPAVIVAVLAIVALWRVGEPPQATVSTPVGTSGSVGREATLEHVRIRERVGDRFYWIGSGDERPVFAVLDPDVKRSTATMLRPGARVTLIGIVRPVPTADEVQQQWHLPASVATVIADSGTYLHVTEIRE